ncbi:MAG: flagellar basal-body MS-ring/collar protein FliF [Verrucomicrobiota bacterium]|nr:flagellar basal-body MS-ring/collar protein FliF [Verrucomicrobiota bacterium]
MEPLKQLGAQLKNIWKQLGINQRVIVAAGGIGIFGGLIALAMWSSQPRYALLYGNLSLKDIDTLRNTLEGQSIPNKIGPNGHSILVPSAQVHEARIFLAGKGLPNSSEKVGLEIFDRPSFGLSNLQQRVNHIRALQGELSNTIGKMTGIEAADVMINMPENKLFEDSLSQASASVFLQTVGIDEVNKNQVRAIQLLVARAVEGLVPDRVSVTNTNGELLSSEPEGEASGFLSDRQLETQRQLETYLSKKVENMLTTVLGPGSAVVRVSAEVNRETVTMSQTKYDEDSIPRSTTETTETTDNKMGSGTTNTNMVAGPLESESISRTTKENEYAVGSTTNDIVTMAGGLKNVTAAVFVSQLSELGADGVETWKAREQNELDEIRGIVSSALGITNTTHISIAQFVPQEDPKTVQLENFQKRLKREEWVQMGTQLGIAGLAVFMLWWFTRTLKKTPFETIPLGIPLEDLRDYAYATDPNAPQGEEARRNRKNGYTFDESPVPDERVEVMNRIIQNNPSNMSQAIQSWLKQENSQSN